MIGTNDPIINYRFPSLDRLNSVEKITYMNGYDGFIEDLDFSVNNPIPNNDHGNFFNFNCVSNERDSSLSNDRHTEDVLRTLHMSNLSGMSAKDIYHELAEDGVVSVSLHKLGRSALVMYKSKEHAISSAIARNLMVGKGYKLEQCHSENESMFNKSNNTFVKGIPQGAQTGNIIMCLENNLLPIPNRIKMSKFDSGLNRGYGYCLFDTKENAQRVIKYFRENECYLTTDGLPHNQPLKFDAFVSRVNRTPLNTNLVFLDLPVIAVDGAEKFKAFLNRKGIEFKTVLYKSKSGNFAFVDCKDIETAQRGLALHNTFCGDEIYGGSNFIPRVQKYQTLEERCADRVVMNANMSTVHVSGLPLNYVEQDVINLFTAPLQCCQESDIHKVTILSHKGIGVKALVCFVDHQIADHVIQRFHGMQLGGYSVDISRLTNKSKGNYSLKHNRIMYAAKEKGEKMPYTDRANTIGVQSTSNFNAFKDRQEIGDALYNELTKILQISALAAKITGMFMEMEYRQMVRLIENPKYFKIKLDEAIKLLKDTGIHEKYAH